MTGRLLQDLIPQRTQNYFQTLTFRSTWFCKFSPSRQMFLFLLLYIDMKHLTHAMSTSQRSTNAGDAPRGGIQKLSMKCFAYILQFYMCMHKLHWQSKYVISKITPVALRQTWLNTHCTETEGRDDLCLWEKVRSPTATQRDCGTNLPNLFTALHPLLK